MACVNLAAARSRTLRATINIQNDAGGGEWDVPKGGRGFPNIAPELNNGEPGEWGEGRSRAQDDPLYSVGEAC